MTRLILSGKDSLTQLLIDDDQDILCIEVNDGPWWADWDISIEKAKQLQKFITAYVERMEIIERRKNHDRVQDLAIDSIMRHVIKIWKEVR